MKLNQCRINSQGILYEQAQKLAIPIKKRDSLQWSINIEPENPIIFKPENPLIFNRSSERDSKLYVDLSGIMEGNADSKKFEVNKYNILIRLWSQKREMTYRKGIDACEIRDALKKRAWKRVMLRFHIDKKNDLTKKLEPMYHLHFGGNARCDEYCWIPKQIKEPRFCHFPMDLVLLCEFILLNFFPENSKDLREKPEWKRLVKKSQKIFLEPYLEKIQYLLNNDNDTLLNQLSICN